MRAVLLNANIWKYYILRILVKRLVWPILTIFLVRNELNATEIGIVFGVGTIIGLVLEIPSGAIADRIGRKKSLLIAQIGQALSMFIFYYFHSFWGFLVANAIYWGAGSFWSGTNDAFIFETLKELGRANEIKKTTGRALFISQVATGFLFVIVPVIAKFNLRLPFLINALVFVCSSILVLTMVEPARTSSVEEKEIGKDLWGIKTFFTNPALLLVGLTFSFIGGINGVLENFRQVYLDHINLDITYFGLIYLGLRLLTGVVGLLSPKLEKYIGRRAVFLLVPLSTLITYVGLFIFNSFWGLFFIFLDGIQEGITRPLEQEYLNNLINDKSRATLLSIFNLTTNLIRALVTFCGGILIDWRGINFGFLFPAILTIVVVGPLSVIFLKNTERLNPKNIRKDGGIA